MTYFDKNNVLAKRKPTDSLISEMILGTLGYCLVFDKYFKDGVKNYDMGFTKFTNKSFEHVFIFIKEY